MPEEEYEQSPANGGVEEESASKKLSSALGGAIKDGLLSKDAKENRARNKAHKNDEEGYQGNPKQEKTQKGIEKGANLATNFAPPGIKQALQTKAGKKLINKGAEALSKMPNMAGKMGPMGLAGNTMKALNQGNKNQNPSAQSGAPQKEGGGSSQSSDSASKGGGSGNKITPFPGNNKGNSLLGGDGGKDQGQDGDAKAGGGLLSMNVKVVKFMKFGLPAIGLMFIFFFIVGVSSDSASDLEAVEATSGSKSMEQLAQSNNPTEQMAYRILLAEQDYTAQGKTISVQHILATWYTIHYYNDSFSASDLTTEIIHEIADAGFEEGGTSFSESAFKNNIIPIIEKYAKQTLSDKGKQGALVKIEEQIKRANDYLGNVSKTTTTCGALGSCSYEIKGFNSAGSIHSLPTTLNVNDLKVRVMQTSSFGGITGKAIDGEELIDFEKYVLGVVYAENGGCATESCKVQAIAARSYALARPTLMGNSAGLKLTQEDGQWILQIRNSVMDQVYCDPDQGCSKDRSANDQWSMVYSGVNKKIPYKPALAEDAPLRQAVSDVMGEVLVDSSGNIISTTYLSSAQRSWNDSANAGKSYTEILLSHYASTGASDIINKGCNTGSGSDCTSPSSGYSGWKQYDSNWGAVKIGASGKTIKEVGCLLTSIAMLIEKSGVTTTVELDGNTFNPGTFVEKMNESLESFTGSTALLNWASVYRVAPTFSFGKKVKLKGNSKEEKFSKIKELYDNGYYIVAEVKGETGSHWVAIDSVSGDTIKMMDPGSNATNMWSEYSWKNTSEVAYYKVS